MPTSDKACFKLLLFEGVLTALNQLTWLVLSTTCASGVKAAAMCTQAAVYMLDCHTHGAACSDVFSIAACCCLKGQVSFAAVQVYLDLTVAPPHTQVKHELLDLLGVQVDCREACCDDHLPGGLRSHKGVAVPIPTHPGSEAEQVVLQWHFGHTNVAQRRVYTPLEDWQRSKDGVMEV